MVMVIGKQRLGNLCCLRFLKCLCLVFVVFLFGCDDRTHSAIKQPIPGQQDPNSCVRKCYSLLKDTNDEPNYLSCYLHEKLNQRYAESTFKFCKNAAAFKGLVFKLYGEDGWNRYLEAHDPNNIEFTIGIAPFDINNVQIFIDDSNHAYFVHPEFTKDRKWQLVREGDNWFIDARSVFDLKAVINNQKKMSSVIAYGLPYVGKKSFTEIKRIMADKMRD